MAAKLRFLVYRGLPDNDTPFLDYTRALIALELFEHDLCIGHGKTVIALRIAEFPHEVLIANRLPCLVCGTIANELADFGTRFHAGAVHADTLVTLDVAESEPITSSFDSPALVGRLVIATVETSEPFVVLHARTIDSDTLLSIFGLECND